MTLQRTLTPPTPLDFHPGTPPDYRKAADAINEVLWVFEWNYPDGQQRGEMHIDTDEVIPRLVLTIYVPDNDDAEDDRVKPLEATRDIERHTHPAEQVRDLIHWFLTHEADEQLLINGVRVWDPHLDEPGARDDAYVAEVKAQQELWDL